MFSGGSLRAFQLAVSQHRALAIKRAAVLGVRAQFSARKFAAAAAGAGAASVQTVSRVASSFVGTAVLLGSGAVVAWNTSQDGSDAMLDNLDLYSVDWVRALSATSGMVEETFPGQMLRKNPVGKLLTENDHLFEGMVDNKTIKAFRCFYDKNERHFFSVVQLGKEVCGFPATVHGGLTAAIMDETFGGLAVCLWRTGALGFRPPAYTARLEVDYKKKIPAGTILLCSTQVESIENRKVWMTASVTNGNGTVYATARALFVSPRVQLPFLDMFFRREK